MKIFTTLLVLLCASLSIGSAQVQKKVTISSFASPGNGYQISNEIPMPSIKAEYQPSTMLSEKVMSNVGFPGFLVAGSVDTIIRPDLDESDSAFALTSRTDPSSRVTTGLYDIPARVNFSDASGNVIPNKIFGYAQFFPSFGKNGSFTIDTLAFQLFQYTRNGERITPVKQSVLLFPFAVKANLQSGQGSQFLFTDPALRALGDEVEVPADLINNALDISTSEISTIVLSVPQWKVEAGESYGFILYSQGETDSMRIFGTYMWGVKDSTQTLGYLMRRTPTNEEYVMKQSNIGFFNPSKDFADAFPSLVNRGLRINYFFAVRGTLTTEPDGVETLSDDARAFALEPVTPNPVVGATKIQFSLQQPSQVSLRVTNSLGQVVKELASGAMNTGTYSADFDANDLPTGMYYYTLVAGTQSLTRSMVVVK